MLKCFILSQEKQRLAAVEAEAKRLEEGKERRKFMQVFPFKFFPTSDSLHADPWREQATASDDFDRMMKHREKEEDRQFASMGYVKGLAADIRDELDAVYSEANGAYREVRELEDRLRPVIGPIPHRPYGEEGPSNWN